MKTMAEAAQALWLRTYVNIDVNSDPIEPALQKEVIQALEHSPGLREIFDSASNLLSFRIPQNSAEYPDLVLNLLRAFFQSGVSIARDMMEHHQESSDVEVRDASSLKRIAGDKFEEAYNKALSLPEVVELFAEESEMLRDVAPLFESEPEWAKSLVSEIFSSIFFEGYYAGRSDNNEELFRRIGETLRKANNHELFLLSEREPGKSRSVTDIPEERQTQKETLVIGE